MNEKHMSKTQLKLINTAGPLFAENGLKGTRIRAITEAAGVNVAGINYHFGGKDKLYQAVADYVFDKIGYINLATYWQNLPKSQRNKDGIYSMIRECLNEIFTKMFKSNHPLWYFKIIQRVVMEHDSNIRDFDNEIYVYDLQAVTEIFQILNKQIGTWDIEAWLAIWYGQTISTSILLPKEILIHGNNNKVIENYIDAVFENTCTAILSLL